MTTARALTKVQIDGLKRLLERRYAALLEDTRVDVARAREENYAAVAGSVTDVGDQAVADLLCDLDHAEVARDVRQAKQLSAALARIDEGTFGRCVQCGNNIDFKRLRAHPAAARCVGCQSVYERTRAAVVMPTL